MADTIDILCGDDSDLSVVNGDFLTGISDEQHVEDLLLAEKGHYKQFPFSGIAIVNHLHAPMSLTDRDNIKREILLQLEADGIKRLAITIDANGTITVKGKYSK